jgi:hypothetical protein
MYILIIKIFIMKKITLLLVALFVTVAMNAQCTEYVGGPYTNFNTLGGAPEPGEEIEIETFEIWESEAYLLDGVIEGETYKFSACNGAGVGSWEIDYAIGPAEDDGETLIVVDAFGLDDGFDCEITFTASASGTYLLVINEVDNCGVEGFVDNGFPKIENITELSVTDQVFNNFEYFTSNDVLTINAASAMENIVVYNLNGQAVLNRVLSSTTESIDLSLQATGVYIVKVSIEGVKKSFRIIK